MNLGVQDFFREKASIAPDCATVTAILTNPDRLQLQLDGATEPGAKGYRYISAYAPVIGDRVLIQRVSGTILVLGKVM